MANSKPAPAPRNKGQQHRPWTATQHRGTQSMPTAQTRHQLRSEGASKILNRANNSRSTEAEASTEVHQRSEVRPTVKTSDITPDVDVYVDGDWAGRATTRKSTTGFVIKFMGAAIHFGSRTQSTTALSSAEAELYAINTGATEALHIRSFLTEALNKKEVNIRIHTDSSSGKSIATRIGSLKKAKRIELKHLFKQQLVLNDVVRIIKINTLVEPADIFTKYVATETLLRHLTEVGINTQPY